MPFLFKNLTTGDYADIFTWLLFIFIFFGSLNLRHVESNTNKFLRTDRNLLIIFVVLIILLFGTRGIKIGTDTWNYHYFYFLKGIRIPNVVNFFNYFETDFLFKVIMYVSFLFKDFTIFLIIVSIIMNFSMYWFVRKFTEYGRSGSSFLLFMLIACNLVFMSHQINTIRNGLAIPFIFFGIYYAISKRNKESMIAFIVAFLLHRTSLLPMGCIIIVLFSQKLDLKYFIGLYVITIVASYFGFGFDKLTFLSSMGAEDLKSLSFSGETNYQVGFKLNFVIYNSVFLSLAMYFGNLKQGVEISLTKYYILASIVFFLNFNIPFSDRIGVYSWIAIPLLFYTIINHSFPNKRLYITSIAAIFYFTLNYILLPFVSSSGDTKKQGHALIIEKHSNHITFIKNHDFQTNKLYSYKNSKTTKLLYTKSPLV